MNNLNTRRNLFTHVTFKFANFIRAYPLCSTSIAALYLSTVWMAAWLIVFAATTVALELNTNARDFIIVLWLSVAVEAVIRWAENTTFVAYLSKPHEPDPKPDNEDFRAGRAFLTFVTIAFLIGLTFAIASDMKDVINPLIEMTFSGTHESTVDGWRQMYASWQVTFWDDNVIISVVFAIMGRAIIYKRSGREV